MADLVSTPDVLFAQGVSAAIGTPLYNRYDLLRQMAEAAVRVYVKWEINQTLNQVDYYDGRGYTDIQLQRPFVSRVVNAWVDNQGGYGSGPNAFTGNPLTQGVDYALVLDQGSLGKSGLLRKLQYPLQGFPSDLVFYRKPGGLAYRSPAYWEAGFGNIKVQYDYGFAAGSIPLDIQLAVVTAVAIILNSTRYGFPLTNEGLGSYNYGLSLVRDREFGTVRQLLSRYMDVAL